MAFHLGSQGEASLSSLALLGTTSVCFMMTGGWGKERNYRAPLSLPASQEDEAVDGVV